jgi:hypothetical protein
LNIKEETNRAKWLLYVGVIYLFALIAMIEEFAYLFRGRYATAEIVNVDVFKHSRMGIPTGMTYDVKYGFQDHTGAARIESDEVGDLAPYLVKADEESARVHIQYTPTASGRSRLAGHRNWVFITIFVLGTGWMGWMIFQLVREMQQPIARSAHRRNG